MSHPNKHKAVIFGAGKAGEAALANLSAAYQINAFSDNNVALHGSSVCGLPVLTPAALTDLLEHKILIASEYAEQIYEQLLQQGIVQSRIVKLAATDIKATHFGENTETKRMAMVILKRVCRALNEAGIDYYVDAGTLLGIYRDGALIPWDDDLDMAISSKEWQQTQQAITDILPELEKLTHFPWALKVYYAGQDFGAVKKGDVRSLKLQPAVENSNLPLMDFFVKYVDGDVMDYTLSSRGIRMPSEHILQLANMEFDGETINIPSNVELYLELHYGDWRTPKKDWDLSELKNATVY